MSRGEVGVCTGMLREFKTVYGILKLCTTVHNDIVFVSLGAYILKIRTFGIRRITLSNVVIMHNVYVFSFFQSLRPYGV